LTDLATVIHAESWAGGDPGCQLVAGTMAQLRGKLLAAGLTGEQLDELAPWLADPRLVLAGHLMYSTSGRRVVASTTPSPG
jgi:hypothetical protein